MKHNNIEPNIDFEYERDVETGEYKVQVLALSTELKESITLDEDVVYLSTPTEGKYSYLFKLREHGIYYFKLLKVEVNGIELDAYNKIEFFVALGENKKHKTLLTKMLNRALVTDDQADVLYTRLKNVMASEDTY